MSQPDMVTETTLEEILAAFNRHDLEAIMAFFAEDCTFDMPRGPSPGGTKSIGKDQVREGLASRPTSSPSCSCS